MSHFVEVPPARLPAEVLQSLLEEFASRDGTDYGERELSLAQKVGDLRGQMNRGELRIVYDADSEQWDLLSADEAHRLLEQQA